MDDQCDQKSTTDTIFLTSEESVCDATVRETYWLPKGARVPAALQPAAAEV